MKANKGVWNISEKSHYRTLPSLHLPSSSLSLPLPCFPPFPLPSPSPSLLSLLHLPLPFYMGI